MELAVAFVIGIAIFVIAFIRLPGLWRGKRHTELERTLSWLPFGAGFRHGVIRAQPAVLLSMGTALLASAALGVTEVTDGGLRLVFIVLGLLLLSTFMLFFVLALTVVFFNWPKKLVPPYLREQTGIVTGWVRPGRPDHKVARHDR